MAQKGLELAAGKQPMVAAGHGPGWGGTWTSPVYAGLWASTQRDPRKTRVVVLGARNPAAWLASVVVGRGAGCGPGNIKPSNLKGYSVQGIGPIQYRLDWMAAGHSVNGRRASGPPDLPQAEA
ncbi:hypothetical protein ACFX1Z_032694 [Malus domestica]